MMTHETWSAPALDAATTHVPAAIRGGVGACGSCAALVLVLVVEVAGGTGTTCMY